MLALIWIVVTGLALPFKSKGRLEAENAILRQQIIVLRLIPASGRLSRLLAYRAEGEEGRGLMQNCGS
jgi:hypothetical protein